MEKFFHKSGVTFCSNTALISGNCKYETLKTAKMERSILSSLVFAILENEEMMNVRGGDGTTTPPPPVKTGIEKDIIL
jgi:hypothetical protein